MYDDPLRQTGRTTRMLQHARQEALSGTRVIILAANIRHEDTLCQHLDALGPWDRVTARGRSLGTGSIEVKIVPHDVDWARLEALSHQGRGADVKVYLDHLTIQVSLSQAIEEFHRWDAEGGR
jgi:hypothetical protein